MLLLDETKLKSLDDSKRNALLLSWLQKLPPTIRSTTREELKKNQKTLVQQLQGLFTRSVPPPFRTLLAQSLVSLYTFGDTVTLFETINKCTDVLRAKEDGSSSAGGGGGGAGGGNKQTVLQCLGAIFRSHGRMAGSLFPDVVQALLKSFKNSEHRTEIFGTFGGILEGLGPSAASSHRDIYKCIRSGLTDKSQSVRSAAAKCAQELLQHSSFLYSQELDSFSNCCLKALEGSSYDVRCAVARLLGSLLAQSQKPLPPQAKGKVKQISLDEALSVLSNGFVRGAGGFLKAGGSDLLKGGSASWEVRVGVTQAYVEFITEMGGIWLERHLFAVFHHILELLASPKTTSTHIDSVYARKCVSFILNTCVSRLLGESAQLLATKHLCKLVTQAVTATLPSAAAPGDEEERSLEGSGEREKGPVAADREEKGSKTRKHMIVCAVVEVGLIIHALNTAALPLVGGEGGVVSWKQPSSLLEALKPVFSHKSMAVRQAGTWCMRCVGLALPSLLSTLIDYLLEGLRANRNNADALIGYSTALAAILATARHSELGVPTAKAELVSREGQELVRARLIDNHSLAVSNLKSGWTLIGAFVSLGPAYVRSKLQELLVLWHSMFPRSRQELNSEISKGSAFSWLIALETRAGALASLCGFLSSCSTLLSPDLIKKIMLPLDSALAMTAGLPKLVKAYGVQLKASGAMLRLRLYQALSLLPPKACESCLNPLLRELVNEFTLLNNPASTTTSLLRSMCHSDDSTLLGSWLEETDQKNVEEMLQPNSAAGSGALEHDITCVIYAETPDCTVPGPLPLGVSVIDQSILLFGRVFPLASTKHHKQLLGHFKDCIKQAKSARQQALQINIFTAFLSALKGLVESKGSLEDNDLISTAYSLINAALSSPDPMLRCAAGEALGRLSQVVGNTSFLAQIVQMSVDALKGGKDVITRTGHSLVLGCLHRYVGGMGSGQHLQISVTTLQEIAADFSMPSAQVWALHALTLIADSGGPLFRNHVDPTLSLVFSLLLATPISQTIMQRCLAKCLSALLTTLGPELQLTSRSMSYLRSTCLTCCTIVQDHPDPVVQSAAISCLQQLQLFAPNLVTLEEAVPRMFSSMESPHLLLRRAVTNCLRQFSQAEPRAIWTILSKGGVEKGLEHRVLERLDVEIDSKLRFDLKEILFSLLTSLAPSDPMKWLLLCNGILSATSMQKKDAGMDEGMGSTARQPSHNHDKRDQEDDGEGDADEDIARFTSGEEVQVHTSITPRWPTKVFTVECSRKIYSVCRNDPAHLDLSLAQQKQRESKCDFLVMHLSELVRTSFIAATASVDQLKLSGYEALQDVIDLFASTPDPDLPGHLLLEQYQAQIGAALRPAFTADTAPHVTAMACQVCSEWLGSGVSRNVGDLKRVQQLLVSSLDKLNRERVGQSQFGEVVATMESLAVLKAWAQLFIKVSEDSSLDSLKKDTDSEDMEFTSFGDSQSGRAAVELVSPQLPILSQYWMAALKDYAYLTLPAQFGTQLPPLGGTFFSLHMITLVRPYYESNWAPILHAAAIWARTFGLVKQESSQASSSSVPLFAATVPLTDLPPPTDERHDTFHLLLGLAVQALCTPAVLDSAPNVKSCLLAIQQLVGTELAQSLLMSEAQLVIELLGLLHRLLLTCRDPAIRLLVLQIAALISLGLKDRGTGEGKEKFQEIKLEHGKSCCFTLLEICSCCLFQLVPSLRPASGHLSHHPQSTSKELLDSEVEMIAAAVQLLPTALSLCAPDTLISTLPSLLYMTLSALKFLTDQKSSSHCQSKMVQTFGLLCADLPSTDNVTKILQSTLTSLLLPSETPSAEDFCNISVESRLALVLVVLVSPVEICLPSSSLFKKCCSFLKECIWSSSIEVQMKSLQVCDVLFVMKKKELAAHFIHALGPELVGIVEESMKKVGPGSRKAIEAKVVIRAIQLLEMLLEKTPEDKKHEMMHLLLPLLVSVLLDSPSLLRSAPKHQRAIHEHVMQKITQIGPKYPKEFRSIMNSSPALKAKLEAAVRNSQASATSQPGSSTTRPQTLRQQQPSIKLKMDFSNFK